MGGAVGPAGARKPAARRGAAWPKAIAVAALSARLMAEAAVRDGFQVTALDLFGDEDTCRVATRWLPLAEPGAQGVDADCTLAALRTLAQRGDVAGWVPGSGFEALPEVLAEGAAWLPLIGNGADTTRRVRDPAIFFRMLGELGVPHPAVAWVLPSDAAGREGWLLKDLRGCGGWHVRTVPPAPDAASADEPDDGVDAGRFYQRLAPGVPMSATFVANGRDAMVLGFNEQIVQPLAGRPWVFAGVVGPVPVAPALDSAIREAVRALAAAFGLRGLGSLDFLLDGHAWQALEINARPPASLACYPDAAPMAAHVRACLQGELPVPPHPAAGGRVHAWRTLFAPRAVKLGEDAARRLADEPGTHDLPCAGARFAPGDPVCSVSAVGPDTATARHRLDEAHRQRMNLLETA